MVPYFSCPFLYSRNAQNMPVSPVQMMPAAPIPPELEQTAPKQTMPMQNMPIQNMPMQNMPMQNMPMQNMPVQNMPMQNMPMQNMPMSMFNVGYLDEFDDSDFSMQTTRPGDPPPVLSNNPPVANVTLFKELTGYPNYGNPSDNADILYTGNQGAWTFDLFVPIVAPGNTSGQIVIRAVLDDHQNVPVRNYSARITINGNVVHNGPVNLEHGVPAGGRFTNWRSLTFNVRNFRRNNRVVIENTSRTGANDWIAFDWMELRLIPR